MKNRRNITKRLLSLVLCLCMVLGMMSGAAFATTNVAAVTIGGVTTEYATLNEAVQAVADCTAEDEAVVKLLSDIDLGSEDQRIKGGVFTLDLNGCELKATGTTTTNALFIIGSDVELTVVDSGEGGKITGNYSAIQMAHGPKVIIQSGTLSGTSYGVHAYNCDVEMRGGAIVASSGVRVGDGCNVTVSAGSIDASPQDFYCENGGIVSLTLGKDGGDGVAFTGGLTLVGVTLGEVISTGMGYGRNGALLTYDADGTTIYGDVVVMADHAHSYEETVVAPTCTEEGYTLHACTVCAYSYTDNKVATTAHTLGSDGICTVCGFAAAYVVTVDGVETNYTDIAEAVEAACGAEAAALTLYQDVPEGFLRFTGGTVTLDLNGCICKSRAIIERCTFTLTDSAESKGALVSYLGSSIEYISGKVIILDTVDATGRTNGQFPLLVSRNSGAAEDSVTIGSTGTEDVVLPSTLVALGSLTGPEVSVLPTTTSAAVILHQHEWIDATCYNPKYCNDCTITVGEALSHSIGDDGTCVNCGVDPLNTIVIYMRDFYGDGWTCNALKVYENGVLVETATIDSGAQSICMIPYDSEKGYTFVWIKGEYADECGFEILLGDEVLYSKEDCSDFTNGETVFTLCDHAYGEGVEKEASCTEKGGIYYTCDKCGNIYIENEVPALGHSYGEDDICDTCGYDKTNVITINMTDDYGDGWNGNAIEVYADGELVAVVTLDDGISGTWTGGYDPEKEYELYWVQGEYPDECSFEVLIGEEVALSVKNGNCANYEDGQMIYPTECETLGHNWVEATCTEPMTCSACGATQGEALGHSREDGYCTVCGAPGLFVGGVAMEAGDYLDLEGNVLDAEPTGGYAYYDGSVLTLSDFTYTGTGLSVPIGDFPYDVLIYTGDAALEIELLGTSTIVNTSEESGNGILMGGLIVGEASALTLSGTGTLNITNVFSAIMAVEITVNSGTWNITENVYGYGIEAMSMTVNGGELNITASGDEDSLGVSAQYFVMNDGRVVLSSTAGSALMTASLTVEGGYLEVKQGGAEVIDMGLAPVTFGDGVAVTSPEGAEFDFYTDENGNDFYTVCNADGTVADAFIIEGGVGEEEKEPFNVEVYNAYGMADTVTLSNPVAIPGQNYVTAVCTTVGTGFGVWGVYVEAEDMWHGNGIYEFDAETSTLTVYGEYVAEGMLIEVVPYVTLTTHVNGGTVREDWQYTYEPDENGVFTEEWPVGKNDGLFGEWDNDLGGIVWDANLVFEREGYKVVGYNTAADGSGTAYAMDEKIAPTEDLEIYLIWECVGHVDADGNGACDVCGEKLDVKLQVKNDGSAIRLLSYVDDLSAYANVKFTVTIGAKTTELVCTNAYTGIIANGNVVAASDVFGEDAAYFVMYTITGITADDYASDMVIEVTWTAVDGTETRGTPRTVNIGELVG